GTRVPPGRAGVRPTGRRGGPGSPRLRRGPPRRGEGFPSPAGRGAEGRPRTLLRRARTAGRSIPGGGAPTGGTARAKAAPGRAGVPRLGAAVPFGLLARRRGPGIGR